MPKRNVEKLIPFALEAINEMMKDKQCNIESEFSGYISSFGPSVIMAGLRQTVLFYEVKEKCVNKLIWNIMGEMGWQNKNTSILELVNNDNNLLSKNRVLEVIVACKLAIRTFELGD